MLCVAQHRRNKNVMTALRAFRRLRGSKELSPETRLIIVGMSGPESTSLYNFVHVSHLRERVIFVSGISDAELQWCYRNCDALLAPSILEGFGLPVIEGRLAGCRIICSDIPAFREVGGPECHYVEAGSRAEEDLARIIPEALRRPKPAPAQLLHVSPRQVSQQYMQLYRFLLAASSASETSPNVPRELMAGEPKPAVADEVPIVARF